MKCFILILFFSIHVLSYEFPKTFDDLTPWDIRTLEERHSSLYKSINRQVAFEFAKKGDSITAQTEMIQIATHHAYDQLSVAKDVLFPPDIYSGMHWALKALDTAFEKKVCVGLVLYSIVDLLTGVDIYKIEKKYYTESKPKTIENLEHLVSYHYASLYMFSRLYSNYAKDDLVKESRQLKDQISHLSKEEQKKVWGLVKNWEKRWGDKPYSPKDVKECIALELKEIREIEKETVTRLLKKIHGQ